jgi:putative FmdB family regulatory protein
MPQYEYFCNSCRKAFTRILTLLEYDERKITCPNCGSKDVEQTLTAFFAVGSKKS